MVFRRTLRVDHPDAKFCPNVIEEIIDKEVAVARQGLYPCIEQVESIRALSSPGKTLVIALR